MAILRPDYFDAINTEEQAYWLGFLTADGCVTSRGQVQLGLADVDHQHVEAFRQAIGASNKTRRAEVRLAGRERIYVSCRFSVGCRRMAAALAQYGVVPAKTGHTIPTRLSDDLERHYWRGLVDGDGTLTSSVDKRWGNASRIYAISLIGDPAVAEAFAQFCARTLGIVRQPKPFRSGLYNIRYSGDAGIAVARLLYKDASIALPRKLAKHSEWEAAAALPKPQRLPYVASEEARLKISAALRLRNDNGRRGKPSPLKGRKYEQVWDEERGWIRRLPPRK